MTISAVIPTLNAGANLNNLLRQLRLQDLPLEEIIIVDSSSNDHTCEIARQYGCVVRVIDRKTFSHGYARNLGASLSHADIFAFFTQDVVPQGRNFFECLTRPLREQRAMAAYARQMAGEHATPFEKYHREFNYPATKTYFPENSNSIHHYRMSNAASAICKEAFQGLGGFRESVIMNEDTIIAAELIHRGFSVSYVNDAVVIHNHDYSILQNARRYFDLGVSMRQASDIFSSVQASGEGLRYLSGLIKYLHHNGHDMKIPRALFESAAKWLYYYAGKNYRILPDNLVMACSMHRAYWSRTPASVRAYDMTKSAQTGK